MQTRPNTLRINVGRLMSDTGVQMDSEWQEEPKSQRHASTPGAELAAQREALGMTVEQIADQLKLAPRQVAAIEKGDFNALPNMAVTRGFIRAYAKAVRLDPAPLVAMIEVEGALGHATATVRPTRVAASFNQSRFPTLTARQGKPMGLVIGGIAVVALLAAAAAWKAGLIAPGMFGAKEPGATTETVPAASAPVEQAPLQSPNVPLISVPATPAGGAPGNTAPSVLPGSGVNPQPAVPATAPGVPAVVPGVPAATPAVPAPAATQPGAVPAPVQPSAAAPAAAAPAAAPLAVAPAAAAPVAAAPATAGKLVLNVKEDSWIEIRRPGSNSLIARLVKAGSTESFDVRAKDLVIVGKPAAVQATLAGAPLDLPPVPGGTIARVNIK